MKKILYSHWYACCLLVLITVFLSGGSAYAVNTFEDPDKHFAVDLPAGWSLQPQTDKEVFVFKGGDNSIIMQYFPNLSSREELFGEAVRALRSSGLPNAVPSGELKDLSVNNSMARWGVYTDKVQYGSITVELYGLLGGVSLHEGGVYFLSVVSEGTLKQMGSTLEQTFQSIRDSGKVLSGVSEVTSVSADTTGEGQTAFHHEYLSLTLPAGWVSQSIPSNFEKEVIGWLKSGRIAGASITVICYRGWRYNYSNVRRGGLKTIALTYPKGQEMLKKPTKIATSNDYDAKVELWRGAVDAGGQTVFLQSPMAVMKTKNCWLLMIGYAPDGSGDQLNKEFTEIVKSAK